MRSVAAIFALLCWIAAILIPFAAWVTHVVNTIQDEQWILLIVGALAFPVGIIHGIGIWFGWF